MHSWKVVKQLNWRAVLAETMLKTYKMHVGIELSLIQLDQP